MIPKRLIVVIAYALPVLIVLFSVLSAGILVLSPTDSAALIKNLQSVCGGVLVLIATDVVLLVGALGLNATVDDSNAS